MVPVVIGTPPEVKFTPAKPLIYLRSLGAYLNPMPPIGFVLFTRYRLRGWSL
ncbi:MAG: hypothetical protein MUF49_20545 [Oculatellaceae cyanobacterium Prado106]|nr:hypothetical protein [Oculatellaceae cyanobacterium Prado106]